MTEATTLTETTAAGLKTHLTEHAAVMHQAESAMAHVRTTLEQARKNGGLQFFNKAFLDFKLREKHAGSQP